MPALPPRVPQQLLWRCEFVFVDIKDRFGVLDVLTVVQQGTIYWRMLRNGLLASFICLVLLNDTLTVKLLDCLL